MHLLHFALPGTSCGHKYASDQRVRATSPQPNQRVCRQLSSKLKGFSESKQGESESRAKMIEGGTTIK